MNISQDGIAALYKRECSPPDFAPALTAYDDGSGNLTIGCGHSGADVRPGMTITREQADALFRKDIAPCEDAINDNVKVPLKPQEFDALCSFTFNVGVGAFEKSTLLKVLNQSKFDQVPVELRKWIYSNGKVNQGLVNRRNSEIGQWTRGAFVSSASVQVDPPQKWWQKLHNGLFAGSLVSMVTSFSDGWTPDTFTNAGQTLQGLSASSKLFATLGVALIVFGVIWRFRKTHS